MNLLGDVNNDGVVNQKDATLLMNHVSFINERNRKYKLAAPHNADVTGDGKVNIGDAVKLQNIVALNLKKVKEIIKIPVNVQDTIQKLIKAPIGVLNKVIQPEHMKEVIVKDKKLKRTIENLPNGIIIIGALTIVFIISKVFKK